MKYKSGFMGAGTKALALMVMACGLNTTLAANKVVAWGDSRYGGDNNAVQHVTDVERIYHTDLAFMALKTDGTVVTWGHENTGGDSSAVADQLNNVKSITTSQGAAAALKADGTVVTWGPEWYGGDSSSVQAKLTNVKKIIACDYAFAALKSDGTVVTWGLDDSAVVNQLTAVREIYASAGAFAALKTNGTVVTWGDSNYGADSSAVAGELKFIKNIYSNRRTFAAEKYDGSLITWGLDYYQGDTSGLDGLTKIRQVVANDDAFAALTNDSRVVTWGVASKGGDFSAVSGYQQHVRAIYPLPGGFAGIEHYGSVFAWGSVTADYREKNPVPSSTSAIALSSNSKAFVLLEAGGKVKSMAKANGGAVTEYNNVISVATTPLAFAAIKGDGSVHTWGSRFTGGDSSSVAAELVNVKAIVGNNMAFAAIVMDQAQ